MARRSRGTPRLANRILKRVRDFAQVKYDGIITEEVARTALDLMDVDRQGLDHIDRNILLTMIQKFEGGPVGLDTLAAAIGEDAGTIEDVYEPYLIKNGFLNRTPRGEWLRRRLTDTWDCTSKLLPFMLACKRNMIYNESVIKKTKSLTFTKEYQYAF